MSFNSLRVSFTAIIFMSTASLVAYNYIAQFHRVAGNGDTTPLRWSTTTIKRPTTRNNTTKLRPIHAVEGNRSKLAQNVNRKLSGTTWKGVGSCEQRFLTVYQRYCEKAFRPKPANIPAQYKNLNSTALAEHLCPCVPTHLLGSSSLQHDLARKLSDLKRPSDGELTSGGRWRPTRCIARQRIAILVPYRNRERNLQALLTVLHQVVRRQLLDFTIFVVEQAGPRLFNRGALLNVGYAQSLSLGTYDCLMLHDVDMLPKNDLNFYTCSSAPRHVGKFRDHRVFNYRGYFGGIVAIRPKHFAHVNGFSNHFYGWGGEDDDFRQRVKAKRLRLSPRYPRCVARYATPQHKLDSGNQASSDKYRGRQFRPKTYKQGLNSLRYQLVNVTNMSLYTNITVILPPPSD